MRPFANGQAHTSAPSAREWARLLGGKVMANGKTVRYPRPGRKPKDRSLTLTVGDEFPDRFSVADPENLVPWREEKDRLKELAGITGKNSSRHRPAGGSIVQEAKPAGVAPREEGAAASPPAFHLLDADEALRATIPDLVWQVSEWMPGNNVTLLGGNGGEGKSMLALQLAYLTRCGMPFFGRSVRAGASVFFSAEETADELAYRLQRILQSVAIGGTPEYPLKMISMADKPALLAKPNRHTGEMEPTPLLSELEALVADTEAVLLIIDAAADVFGGSEIDRQQVRSFISLLRAIGIRRQCAVLLLAHPSVSGMSDGRGYSGATAWNNSVRSRLYLTTPKSKDENEVDPSLRQLEVMKVNNAARGAKVFMRFDRGAFHQQSGVREGGLSVEQQVKAMTVFLELLQRANDQGDRLSNTGGANFAPKILEQAASKRGVTRAQLTWAMREGLDVGRVAIKMVRVNGREAKQLVVVGGTSP